MVGSINILQLSIVFISEFEKKFGQLFLTALFSIKPSKSNTGYDKYSWTVIRLLNVSMTILHSRLLYPSDSLSVI